MVAGRKGRRRSVHRVRPVIARHLIRLKQREGASLLKLNGKRIHPKRAEATACFCSVICILLPRQNVVQTPDPSTRHAGTTRRGARGGLSGR